MPRTALGPAVVVCAVCFGAAPLGLLLAARTAAGYNWKIEVADDGDVQEKGEGR